MRVLLKFNHGLGDAVQLTIVLQHLKKYRPDWSVTVSSLYGKHSAHFRHCVGIFSDREQRPPETSYDKVLDLPWHECGHSFEHVPSTKAALCLTELEIQPDPALFYYSIYQSLADKAAAAAYLRSVTNAEPVNGRWPVALLHYEGNTAIAQKNLSHSTALTVCRQLRAAGLCPVILDWDYRSPIIDGKTIHCPDARHPLWKNCGTGDAGILAALIEKAQLMIGIDSGPLHVAGATTTPTLGVWTGHLPIRYFDFADNVTHLVPPDWRQRMSAQQAAVFEQNYQYVEQTKPPLAKDIVSAAAQLINLEIPDVKLSPLVECRNFMVRADNVGQDLVIVSDVYENDCYKLNIIPQVVDQAKVVVDIGAHIGTFAKLVHEKNPGAKIICVEACPENLEALRANVGDFAEIVHAACTYEDGELALCNAVRANCESTGGSIVVSADEVMTVATGQYWPDRRPLEKVTLEQLAARFGFDQIDLLKLDCEGSEYSILGGCDSTKVRFVVGEYHGQARWDEFRAAKFSDWDYGHMSQSNNMGNFHLRNVK